MALEFVTNKVGSELSKYYICFLRGEEMKFRRSEEKPSLNAFYFMNRSIFT